MDLSVARPAPALQINVSGYRSVKYPDEVVANVNGKTVRLQIIYPDYAEPASRGCFIAILGHSIVVIISVEKGFESYSSHHALTRTKLATKIDI